MKLGKITLIILLAAILGAMVVQPARANPITPPTCGSYTVSTSVNLSTPIVQVASPWIVAPFFLATSLDGWRITHISLDVITLADTAETRDFPYSAMVTSVAINLAGDAKSITNATLKLKKDCADGEVSECKTTENYVYTLLGNYPCNLVAAESPIPPRFLNPDFTGPLCALPDRDFSWNGEYVVNRVKNCDGYLVGGQYFDTHPALP